ncbi:FadR/GntR family transcriptional regulator [Nakamurella deserti]|uniref:FadR/GntR family transcriptional regulator n=1 Tax=Nakamurella deserti TaxID=2164074 RepID=UPI000DBEA25C|nr:FCD domain-containing protein [Nakamurella deserti]
MPSSVRSSQEDHDLSRAAVFAPLEGGGRAELVERRLAEAIAAGLLHHDERLPREADLARRFGVATVTAREALEALRHRGLVRTTRGRDGGSFVTAADRPDRAALDHRLRQLSRVDLRDMATYYRTINAGAAELAADRAAPDDVAQLRLLVERTGTDDPVAGRRGENAFHLQLAALSQSPRLVREEVRLQAEFGALLWRCQDDPHARVTAREAHDAIAAALDDVDTERARALTAAHVDASLEWLVDHKSTLDSGPPTVPVRKEPPS